jgi:GABA(A) receptor-associated protein
MDKFEFKNTSFDERKAYFDKMSALYPDKVFIICEHNKSSDIEVIDKKKFIVPRDITMLHFMQCIRRRMKSPMQSSKAMYIYAVHKSDNILIPSTQLMSHIYDTYKDDDGFLYIIYSCENTFG